MRKKHEVLAEAERFKKMAAFSRTIGDAAEADVLSRVVAALRWAAGEDVVILEEFATRPRDEEPFSLAAAVEIATELSGDDPDGL